MNKNKITYSKKSGFGVNEDYFDQIETCIFSRIELEEKTLCTKSNHGGMIVPDNYFDKLEENLCKKIASKKEIKVISLTSVINWSSAAVIFFGLSTYFFTQLPSVSKAPNNALNLSDLSSEGLEIYIEESLFGSDLEYYLNGKPNYDFAASLHSDINTEAYLNYIEDELLDEDY